jgi:hypothetical protein
MDQVELWPSGLLQSNCSKLTATGKAWSAMKRNALNDTVPGR